MRVPFIAGWFVYVYFMENPNLKWKVVGTCKRPCRWWHHTVPGRWGKVSETVAIYTFLYFWNKFLVQIPWKGRFESGKSSVLQARSRSFVRRGFRRKVPFFLSSAKLSEVVQDIAFDALAPDCSIQVLPIFSEILSAVFMCMQLPGNRVFKPIPLSTHPTV